METNWINAQMDAKAQRLRGMFADERSTDNAALH